MQEALSPPLRFIVVAELNQQRLAFSDTIRTWGYELVDCVSGNQLTDKHFQANVDIWLVDSEQDFEIIQALEPKLVHIDDNNDITLIKPNPSLNEQTARRIVLVGFNAAPYLNESQPYGKWQRQLKRKIAERLNRPELIEKFDQSKSEYRPWKYVVVLGASMGGPLAVKEFLDELPSDLPIAIILAQHFNHGMLNSLPRVLNRHNQWRCDVVTSTQRLMAGSCLIVPIEKSVICDSNGRVIIQPQAWQGIYQPSISQLLVNCSEVFGNTVINIIFSGMGNDGSSAATTVKKNNSTLWVQTPETCACPSQPQSIIDTGLADYIATPKALAQALITLCKTRRLPSGYAIV